MIVTNGMTVLIMQEHGAFAAILFWELHFLFTWRIQRANNHAHNRLEFVLVQ